MKLWPSHLQDISTWELSPAMLFTGIGYTIRVRMHLPLSLGGPEMLFFPSGNCLLKVICTSMTVRLNYWQSTICLGVKPEFKKPPCLVQYAAVPRLNKIKELYVYSCNIPTSSHCTLFRISFQNLQEVRTIKCQELPENYSRNREPQSSWLCARESITV